MTAMNTYRIRRRHEKSRNGCVRCKQQRKKCDEEWPACTRCSINGYCCAYIHKKHHQHASHEAELAALCAESGQEASPPGCFETANYCAVTRGSVLSSPPSMDSSEFSCYRHKFEFLAPAELSLVRYYQRHTSRRIALDTDELSVLQVGIPCLATNNRPLMASSMALAAVSVCYDLVNRSRTIAPRAKVNRLLAAADRYYHISLSEMREAIYFAESYDHVLANAALMVMYGLARQSIHARLVRNIVAGDGEWDEVQLSAPCQWMRLIRAAYMACTGSTNEDASRYSHEASPTCVGIENNTLDLDTTISNPETGPSETTRKLFLPIVKATYRTALTELQTRAQMIASADEVTGRSDPEFGSTTMTFPDCLRCLDVLTAVASEIFSGDVSSITSPKEADLQQLPPSDAPISRISPWLRTYMARVTSIERSRPLRRAVMSFLNRVPVAFLDFVQSFLEQLPTNSNRMPTAASQVDMESWPAANLLALDIFAHWLVLVMLLDGVWWIGGVGQWELSRLSAVLLPRMSLERPRKDWWPRSMLTIYEEISGQAES